MVSLPSLLVGLNGLGRAQLRTMQVAMPVGGSYYAKKCNGHIGFDGRSGFCLGLLCVERDRWRMAIWLVIATRQRGNAEPKKSTCLYPAVPLR